MIADDLCPEKLPLANAEHDNRDPTLKVRRARACMYYFAVLRVTAKLNPNPASKALSGDYQLEACTPFHLNFKFVFLCIHFGVSS